MKIYLIKSRHSCSLSTIREFIFEIQRESKSQLNSWIPPDGLKYLSLCHSNIFREHVYQQKLSNELQITQSGLIVFQTLEIKPTDTLDLIFFRPWSKY